MKAFVACGIFSAAVALTGSAQLARADILVHADGTMSDDKVISQNAREVIVRPDSGSSGQSDGTTQHLDRSTLPRVLVTDEHGALLTDNGATPRPSPHANVPPEPAAPPIVRPAPGKFTYYLIPLHGEVGDTVLASALEQSMADAAARKPTVVVLDIDSPGGLVEEAQKILKVIHHYNKQLRIVALTDKDLSAAAIFSLSVKEIYVKSTSTIGAATSFQPNNLTLPPKIEEKMQSAWRAVARNSAEEGGHDPLLSEAMIDNDVELHLETFDGKTVVKDGPGDRLLCRKGKILTLSSHEAVECGLAAGDADDVDELGQELKMPGWTECKGLGTLLAAYLPKKGQVLKAESARIMGHFQQDLEQAKESDPAEVISRVVRSGPPIYRPPMPGRMIPGRPGFQPGGFQPGGFQPRGFQPGGTTVVTTVSRSHWKARSLACVVALQRTEADLIDAKALCDDFGQRGASELFGEAQTQLGALRARIYDDRNKYGPGIPVAVNPTTRPGEGPAQSDLNPPRTPRMTGGFDRGLPSGAIETQILGGNGGSRFVHASPSGAPVVGFRYASGNWMGKSVLRQLDPFFDRPAADAPAALSTVFAREGYVVGGLTVENDGKNVVAVQVLFVRFTNGQIKPADNYKSDWIGTSTGAATQELGGKNQVIIGTCGRKGLNLDALGLVLARGAGEK